MGKKSDLRLSCSVASCANHCEGDLCSLNAVNVQPCRNCNTGNPEDESMCGSYRPQ